MYTKFCQNMRYICILQTFFIHFLYINSDLQKVYITNIMYAICIHTYPLYPYNFDPFVVHFLVNS